MKWLKRVLSAIWTEPRDQTPVFNVKSTETVELDDQPLIVETNLYKIFLSSDWTEKQLGDVEQYCFHHAEFDIDMVISDMAVKIPQNLLRDGAENLLNSQSNGVDRLKREMGISPINKIDDLVEQSWGYQVRVSRIYHDNEIYLFTGFVSQNLILNITFEGQDKVIGSFDSAVTSVLSGIRFSNEVWGDKNSSPAPSIH